MKEQIIKTNGKIHKPQDWRKSVSERKKKKNFRKREGERVLQIEKEE